MTHFFVGAPSNDKAILHAILLRFGDMRRGELTVKSSQNGVVPHGEMYHNWISGIGIFFSKFLLDISLSYLWNMVKLCGNLSS